MRAFVFIFVILLFGFMSLQAKTISVDESLERTLQNQPQIQRAQAQRQEATWKKRESYSGYLPSLSLQSTYLTQKKYLYVDMTLGGNPTSVPQIVPTLNHNLNLSWLLFDGFANERKIDSAHRIEAAADLDVQWVKFSLQRQTLLRFYKSLSAKAMLEVSDQNLKTINDHLEKLREQKRIGTATAYDTMRMESQQSVAQSEKLEATHHYESSTLELAELMGNTEDLFDPVGEFPEFQNISLPIVDKIEIEKRADLKALKERSASAYSAAQAQSRHWIPRIYGIGQYQYYNNRTERVFYDADNREAYSAGFLLSWNLLDGGSSTSRSEQASAQALQAQKTLEITINKAHVDTLNWGRKFKTFITILNARRSDVKRATEALRLAEVGLQAGSRTSGDLLDAELDLFRARSGVVNAQFACLESLTQWELASGKSILNLIKN